jgi:hypothetical protein
MGRTNRRRGGRHGPLLQTMYSYGGRSMPSTDGQLIDDHLMRINVGAKLLTRRVTAQQAIVAREIGTQIAAGTTEIRGGMLESFLVPGRQGLGRGEQVFGQSVTDACIGWETTVDVLNDLTAAVRRRRDRRADRTARIRLTDELKAELAGTRSSLSVRRYFKVPPDCQPVGCLPPPERRAN